MCLQKSSLILYIGKIKLITDNDLLAMYCVYILSINSLRVFKYFYLTSHINK